MRRKRSVLITAIAAVSALTIPVRLKAAFAIKGAAESPLRPCAGNFSRLVSGSVSLR